MSARRLVGDGARGEAADPDAVHHDRLGLESLYDPRGRNFFRRGLLAAEGDARREGSVPVEADLAEVLHRADRLAGGRARDPAIAHPRAPHYPRGQAVAGGHVPLGRGGGVEAVGVGEREEGRLVAQGAEERGVGGRFPFDGELEGHRDRLLPGAVGQLDAGDL